MAADNDLEIRFNTSNLQENVRFLELPEDLLKDISDANPTSLSLKSSGPGSGGQQQLANAVLCTAQRTFQIRQVQSSNSVFVVRPSESHNDEDGGAKAGPSLSSIATCATTLELLPCSHSGTTLLKDRIPIYQSSGADQINDPGRNRTSLTNKGDLFSNLPLSTGELEESWKELCAFEADGAIWRPRAETILSVWRSLLSAAALRGFDLGTAVPMSSLRETFEEDGHPTSLLFAALARISRITPNPTDNGVSLDKLLCTTWIGEVLLQDQSPHPPGISLNVFLQKWRDLLPESWREEARIDLLKGLYTQPSRSTIAFRDGQASSDSSLANSSNAKGALQSRKWHEKFKTARK